MAPASKTWAQVFRRPGGSGNEENEAGTRTGEEPRGMTKPGRVQASKCLEMGRDSRPKIAIFKLGVQGFGSLAFRRLSFRRARLNSSASQDSGAWIQAHA